MESQKIKNLLDHKDDDDLFPKYQTKTWYIINDGNNGQYPESDNIDNNTIKSDTEVVKPFLYDYFDAYILVTGDIRCVGGNSNTKYAFKNCNPFVKSIIPLNDVKIENSDNLDIIMNMYNLIEYSDNYSDSTGSLYQFKRQEPSTNNDPLAVDTSSSFKYKFDLLGNTAEESADKIINNTKIIVPLKYISSFFKSLEMPLINTKLFIQLN